MNKTEYIESRNGELHSVIIATQPTESVIGSIRGDNLRNVVAILAGGLQYRLDNAEDSPLRTALLTAFKYLTLQDYSINLALPENAGMLRLANSHGLVSDDELAQFFALATYERPLYNITADDFVGEWVEIPPTDSRSITFTLNKKAPEQTYILIQWQDKAGDWYHATALHGVEAVKSYTAALPYDGEPRALRWRCAYALDVVVG